ncbi:hypothetical protein RB195_024383 [Necator americanus]|uniref:Reverse transcriptase domain-containing protein n=1 Tax=Necator americanus TaxID=51031 RepID=A0ABR1EQ50_NECAM
MTDIQTVSRVIGVCQEYRLPLFLTFVDYEKASESIETNAVLSALVDEGVYASCLRTRANCYDRCKTTMQPFHCPLSKSIGTAVLQWIMKSLDWEERGIRVDGRFLSTFLSADIAPFSRSTSETETMIKKLNEAGKRIGLGIKRKKKQFIKNVYCEGGHVANMPLPYCEDETSGKDAEACRCGEDGPSK